MSVYEEVEVLSREMREATHKFAKVAYDAGMFYEFGEGLASALGNTLQDFRDAHLHAMCRARDADDSLRELLRAQNSGHEWHFPRRGYFVYRLLGQEQQGETVYVGRSKSFSSRLAGHADKDWSFAKIVQVQTKEEMMKLEENLIHELHPKYNKRCAGCGYRDCL
jgi:hypothetical protein